MACHPERKLKHHCGWKHWPCPDTRHFLALKHCLLTVLQHSWMNLHFPGKMLKYVLMGLGPWLSWTEMQAHVWNWNVPCGFLLSRRPAKWKCSLADTAKTSLHLDLGVSSTSFPWFSFQETVFRRKRGFWCHDAVETDWSSNYTE